MIDLRIDKVFGVMGDCDPTGVELQTLQYVAGLLSEGQPVPPQIGAWLARGIRTYLDAPEGVTLGGVLGLEGRSGQKALKRCASNESLATVRYFALRTLYRLGATKVQAAELVCAAFPGASVEHVARLMSADDVKHDRRDRLVWRKVTKRAYVQSVLDHYPTNEQTREAKRELLKLYPS